MLSHLLKRQYLEGMTRKGAHRCSRSRHDGEHAGPPLGTRDQRFLGRSGHGPTVGARPCQVVVPNGGSSSTGDSDFDGVAPTIINNLDIRIINPTTGELLRQLTLNPTHATTNPKPET